MSFEEREATVRPLDDRAPVLVGIGTVEQRLDDPLDAKEPLSLMLEAIQRAGADSGRPELLTRVDYLAVPRGRWRYEDPGRYLAEAIESERAESILMASPLQWTIVRPTRLTDGPFTGTYQVAERLTTCGGKISRADVADLMVQAIGDSKYVRRAVGQSY